MSSKVMYCHAIVTFLLIMTHLQIFARTQRQFPDDVVRQGHWPLGRQIAMRLERA